MYPCVTFFKWSQLGEHYFLVYLFQLLSMSWATMCHHQVNLLYLSDIGILHSVWVAVWSADQTATQLDKECSLDDGHIVAETCREVEINILRSSVHLVGFIWKSFLPSITKVSSSEYKKLIMHFAVYLVSRLSNFESRTLCTESRRRYARKAEPPSDRGIMIDSRK